ncbi:MAG TPA: 50S ribosomal protein L11 methyltransferase [Candidatus Polarisedimenticolia bacterium]|nr:50S ribosomal protein L11 methyltransferase [Candidatus Polarisedimenticolia bacterium]
MSRPRLRSPRRPPLRSTRTWWQVPLTVPARLEETVVAALWEEGCLGVESRGLPSPQRQSPETWSDAGPPVSKRLRIPLAVFFPGTLKTGEASARVRRALAAAGLRPGPARARRVADRRWVEEWQRSLRPMPIGRRLLALPEGLNPPPGHGRIVLRIPFGQAFGTGEHASTRLSLGLLEESLRPGDEVLDLGTGTGILALAAVRLGARRAVAVDADPVAVAVARRTLRMNRGPRAGASPVTVRRADAARALAGQRYDFALVNIGARVIRDLLPALAQRARPRARIVLAGLLIEDEKDLLRRAREAGLRFEARRRARPWSALLLRAPGRRSPPRLRGCPRADRVAGP